MPEPADERPSLLHQVVDHHATGRPDDLALVHGHDRWTWARLSDAVDALARALTMVAEPGDRVAFVSDNVPEWVVAYYAVPKAGMRLAFVNQRLGVPGIRSAIADVDPAVLIASPAVLADLRADDASVALAPTVVALGDATPDAVSYARFVADATAHATDAHAHADVDAGAGEHDVAWLIATSGTSGSPKPVALTHANLLAAVDGTVAVRPLAGDETYLFPFPLCHVAGYNVVQFHRHGRPVVLLTRFDPADFVEQVRRHRVTTASLAPTMIALLLDHLDEVGGDVAPLRAITYGSAPISPELLRRAIERLGVDFLQGYGMTEMAGNGVFLSAEEHRLGLTTRPELLTAAGRPTPTLGMRLVDDSGAEVAPGEAGEVAVKGPQVTPGYWNQPDANAASFTADGWFRTGDIGRVDADGYLSIVDRKKDLIVTGGENVASREVEEALATHPGIREVAVVGVPDPTWGESVAAIVVPRPGVDLTPADVLAYGRRAIGGFKKPKHVLVVDDLPRNGSGKVVKPRLRQLAADSFGPAEG